MSAESSVRRACLIGRIASVWVARESVGKGGGLRLALSDVSVALKTFPEEATCPGLRETRSKAFELWA